jgi:hypothetical protein
MRINIWIILAALLALLVITRYMQEDRDRSASVPMTRLPRCVTGETVRKADVRWRDVMALACGS